MFLFSVSINRQLILVQCPKKNNLNSEMEYIDAPNGMYTKNNCF